MTKEKKPKRFEFQKDMEIDIISELDPDFMEQDNYSYPFYKIQKTYYFGGVRKHIFIPISSPHKVIVEANPPRQGYSYLTWNTLNCYYLQKCMTAEQYKRFIHSCRDVAFSAHASNREEQKFDKKSFQWCNMFTIAVCFISVILMLFAEIEAIQSDDFHRTTSILVIEGLFLLSILMVFTMSFWNFCSKPPKKIFVNYEDNLRQKMQSHLDSTFKNNS